MIPRYYPAVFEKAADGGIGVFFPDLPGCVSGGDAIADAMANAESAAAIWIADAVADGEAPPRPSALERVKPGRGVKVAAIQLVRVDIPGSEPAVKFSASMDPALLRRIDAAAADRGTTRSGFLAQGAAALLGGGVRPSVRRGSTTVRRRARS